MSEKIVVLLKEQAEIAIGEGLTGYGALMSLAAKEIEGLRKKLHSAIVANIADSEFIMITNNIKK